MFDETFRSMFREELRGIVREVLQDVRAEEPDPVQVPTSSPSCGGVLTAAQVAEHCHHHPATVRAWIKSGRLKASKPARHYLVRLVDLERFLAQEQDRSGLVAVPDAEDEAARILNRLNRRK